MGYFSNLFSHRPPSEPPAQEPVIPVPIPALGMVLLKLEEKKGHPLTEVEVLKTRDDAVCMMMRLSHKRAIEEERGYRDVDPENVWEEWLAFREEMKPNET